MKKILLLLPGLILILFSAFAISLSEIQSDPGRYVKVAEGQTTTMYVDSYSIQSLRYAPPYYTIQGKIRVCQEFCVNRFNKQHRIAA